MRTFESGATRDSEDGKLDFDGFLSDSVMLRFAEYMHEHRIQSDGKLRASDNWKKGIPLEAYRKSAFRHFFDWWSAALAGEIDEDAACALMFNLQGSLHEHLKAKSTEDYSRYPIVGVANGT